MKKAPYNFTSALLCSPFVGAAGRMFSQQLLGTYTRRQHGPEKSGAVRVGSI